MDNALRAYALRDVPRYTSYPTAVRFAEGFAHRTWRGWLARLGAARRLSLYVHIPFCRQLCWYCGCHTSVTGDRARARAYAGTLIAEIESTGRLSAGASGRVAHLHFGGGSPTCLEDEGLQAILGAIERSFGFAGNAQIAIEIDPRTMGAGRAARLAAMGVTRASLGVQDFDRRVQRKINRVQPFAMVEGCVAELRAAGVEAIGFDLMYGLPGQTSRSVVHSARLAASLRPDRIAVFGYAHVPWFKKHQQMIRDADLPGAGERFDQARAIGAILARAGYRAIGLDHFALPDDAMARAAEQGVLRRNFQGYTVDPADALIGFGASAISALPQGYVQNVRDIKSWSERIAGSHCAVERGLVLTADDRMRAHIIERLMCDLAVDAHAIARVHGFDPAVLDGAFARLRPLQADGLVEVRGHRVSVPERHRPFLRTVAAAFDAYFVEAGGRHARAV